MKKRFADVLLQVMSRSFCHIVSSPWLLHNADVKMWVAVTCWTRWDNNNAPYSVTLCMGSSRWQPMKCLKREPEPDVSWQSCEEPSKVTQLIIFLFWFITRCSLFCVMSVELTIVHIFTAIHFPASRCSLLLFQMQHLSETSSAAARLLCLTVPSNSLDPSSSPPQLSLTPLHAGKWFYPVEWLCKDGRRAKGFKAEPGKRAREQKRIDKEKTLREQRKDSLETWLQNVLALCKAMTHRAVLLYMWTSGAPNRKTIQRWKTLQPSRGAQWVDGPELII